MIHCAMMHVRIHARMHVYMRVYMSNPFAHAHNAHKLLDRMLADYQQRSAYVCTCGVRSRPMPERGAAKRATTESTFHTRDLVELPPFIL